jgi:cell surface protein SprA
MLGVRNPYKGNSPVGVDDGLAKSAYVWFDELRLTDFNNKGGWAALGRADVKLADFATVSVSGSHTTSGFGTLDSKPEDRTLFDNTTYNIAATLDLGRLLPAKANIKIPTYINIANSTNMPEYDPSRPDILLSTTLSQAKNPIQRDSIRNVSEDYTMRRSYNFTDVKKVRLNPNQKMHFWDLENWSLSYSYNEYLHHDFTTLSDLEKTYHAAFVYNYVSQPKYITPLQKLIKKNSLALIRDINFDLFPTRVNFSINFDRFYSENTLRNNDPADPVLPTTTFNKSFLIKRLYGIGWNITKSLSLDFDATNLSTVDEPYGRLTGNKTDSLWHNLVTLGRTTNYTHNIVLNYNIPFNKIPGLDWITAQAKYSTNFTWQSEPEFAISDPQFNVGNSIQNARRVEVSPVLNFTGLYRKFAALKNVGNPDDKSFKNVLLGILTGVKTITGSFTRTDATFLPGYLPQSNLGGYDLNYNAPGINFLLGGQADLRAKAVAGGWLSTDSLQNQLYVRNYTEDYRAKITIEPIRDLRIELSGFKTQDRTYQSNFKYNYNNLTFENQAPITSGDYTISYLSIATAFKSESGVNNTSQPFSNFQLYRSIISKRLGLTNPNSGGTLPGSNFADGYSAASQNVVVPAFLAAYSGKSPGAVGLSQFPSIPMPNWSITYSGLAKISFLKDIFDSFNLKHGYNSSYTVSGYGSLLQYQENNGAPSARDANGDFLPQYQFSSVTILEQFVPLLGADMRFKNSMTANVEYRQSRMLSLSVLNSQLTQQNDRFIVLGFGYKTKNFRFPFGMFNNTILKNDLTFKVDFALHDNKTLIYQADVLAAQVSSGAQNIQYRPSIDYALNQRFNLSLFYDSNLTKPYTSQSFNTAFTNFGFDLKLLLQ